MTGTKKPFDRVVARANEQRKDTSEKEAPAKKTTKKRAASSDGDGSPLPAKKAKLTHPTAKASKKRSAPADEESHVSRPAKKVKRASKCSKVKQEGPEIKQEPCSTDYPSRVPPVKLEPLSEEQTSFFDRKTPALIERTREEDDDLEALVLDGFSQPESRPAEQKDQNSAPSRDEDEDEEDEEDDYDPIVAAAIQTIIADEQPTFTTAPPPSPKKLMSFDELLWRAARAGEIRGQAPPSSRYPPTATESHTNGSLSIVPRPENWDHIYCPKCHTWGSNCFYNVQGCVYQRYAMPVKLGGRCRGECGYCAVSFDAARSEGVV